MRMARKQLDRIKSVLPLHVLLVPCVVATFIFAYIPLYGVIIGFKDYRPKLGMFGSEWVGFRYFERYFSLMDFWRIMQNTIQIAVTKILLMQVFSILFALLLNEIKRRAYRRTIQSFVIFPHFISWVVIGSLVKQLVADNGIINNIIVLFGGTRKLFLADNYWFMVVLHASNLWKGVGFSSLLISAAIEGIDPCLYEAASLDGAGKLRQAYHVTLPGIASFLMLLAVLNIGGIFDAGFDQIFNLYNFTVYEVADVISTYVYRIGFESGEYSFATAVGLFQSMIGCALFMISLKLAYKYTGYRLF